MNLKSKIISKIIIEKKEIPRISFDGNYLVPFNISLDEVILNDEIIIKYIAKRISKLNFEIYNPVIYVENNDFSKKIYEKLIKRYFLKNGKQWKKNRNLSEIEFLDKFIFIEPCLSCIDQYWNENENSSFIFEKKGLIPTVKEYAFPNTKIFTLYSDSFDVIPNVEIYPLVVIDDLIYKLKNDIRNKCLSEWANNPNLWTLLWIRENKNLLKQLIEGTDYRKELFIDNYRKSLEKLGLIKKIDYHSINI